MRLDTAEYRDWLKEIKQRLRQVQVGGGAGEHLC